MKERRRQKRYSAQYPVTVYDTRTNEPFGQLIDLSCDGMRILSNHPTEFREDFSLSFDLPAASRQPGLPEDVEVTEQITVDATSVWCDQILNSTNYDSGMVMVNPDPETLGTIRTAFQDALFRHY